MAVDKAIRSKSPAQLQPQPQRLNHQFKAEILNVLRHLNRGYGVALAALDKLEFKDRLPPEARPRSKNGLRIFAIPCLREFRARTLALQAEANRDLLQLMATHEDQYAQRSGASRG
jgi:hypothetical protein